MWLNSIHLYVKIVNEFICIEYIEFNNKHLYKYQFKLIFSSKINYKIQPFLTINLQN